MSRKARRFARRLLARQQTQDLVEQRREERRQRERRDLSLSPEQVEARLRELGITDRRRGERRK